MKALFLKALSIAALSLLFPGVAVAKGPGLQHVTLDGPGIGHPLRIEKHFPYLLDDAIFLHVFGSTSTRNVSRERPWTTDLGPRFRLDYHMTWGRPVEIDLYPYADRGPVAYAAEGQAVSLPIGYSEEDHDFPVHAGWYDYRPAIVDLLQEGGLPTQAEIDGDARRPASALAIVAVAMALTAALVGLGRRRRR